MGFSSMKECGTPDSQSNKFIPSMNSYYDIGKSNSFNLASQLDAGLMSVDDFCKLNTIVIPPPFITITSNKCSTTIKGGIIGIVSGDSYIKVDSSVDIKQNEDGITPAEYESIPLKIHGNTYGIRFSLDIDRLSAYLIRNGRLILKGTVGVEGEVGETGAAGDDYILSGPKGNDGLPGTTPPINTVIQNETIDVVNVGSTGITDIQPIINNDGTYDLVLTRQPIGDTNVATNRISVNGTETNWAVVVQGPGASRDPYYLDLGPIHTAIYSRATTYSELIKKGYEDAVKFWIKTMSDLFDSQKSALCCALDRCKSRIKNDSLRRHFELTSATAKPDYKTIIKTRRDDPETQSSTGILKELYPDGDFCKDPPPKCGMVGSITPVTTAVNCSSPAVYVSGTIRYTTLDKDISDVLTLTADVGDVSPNTLTRRQLLDGSVIKYSCAASVITVSSSGKCVVSDDLSLPDLPNVVCEFGVGEITLDRDLESCNIGVRFSGIIRYDSLSTDIGPFNLTADVGTVTPSTATRSQLLSGLSISFDCAADFIQVRSIGDCEITDSVDIPPPNVIFEPRICRQLNIVLAIDDTGSMGGVIDNVKSGFSTILSTVSSIDPGARISIVTFKDDAVLLLPFTPITNISVIQSAVNSLTASGGGDTPEALGAAVALALTQFTEPTTVSRANLIITVTDAEAREGRAGLQAVANDALANEIPIFALVGLSPPALEDSKFLATTTRGFWSSNLDSNAFINEILRALEYWCSYDDGDPVGPSSLRDPAGPSSLGDLMPLSDDFNTIEDVVNYNETEILLNASENINYPSNAVTLELPKGTYRISIVDTNSFINGKYHSVIKILTTKGMTYRSMDFVNKGSFGSEDESRLVYENNAIIVDHDGGLLKAYFIGEYDVNNSGSTVLSISVLRLTLNSKQLQSLLPLVKNNIVRVKNIDVDISLDGVNTDVQTSFEFNGTILVPTKNI